MIVAVHGACVGAGVDLICACDIRYCTEDAWFQVKVSSLLVRRELQLLECCISSVYCVLTEFEIN